MVELSRKQANDAVILCLKNAREYLEDSKIHYEKRRLQHIRIPFQFALEEAGKAKTMMDQLQNGNSIIMMNRAMRKEHQLKVEYIRQFVRVSSEKEQYYNDVWFSFPFLNLTTESSFTGEAEKMRQLLQKQMANDASEKFVKLDQDILQDIITDSHDKRLGTLVNFDDTTYEPKLDPPMREGDCDLLIDTIENMLNSFDEEFSRITL